MPLALVRYAWPTIAATSVAFLSHSSVANAATPVPPPVDSGGWIAIAIIAFLVWAIYLLIRGSLSEERRSRSERGWFGILPQHDDDDHHHGLHHGDGGGEGFN